VISSQVKTEKIQLIQSSKSRATIYTGAFFKSLAQQNIQFSSQ